MTRDSEFWRIQLQAGIPVNSTTARLNSVVFYGGVMRIVRLLTALLAVAGPGRHFSRELPVVAAEPVKSSSQLQTDVRQLLKELSGPTRAERSNAAQRLLEIGPKVLPLLPPPELLP